MFTTLSTVLSTFCGFETFVIKRRVKVPSMAISLEKGNKFFPQKNLREGEGEHLEEKLKQGRLWKQPGPWPASSQGASIEKWKREQVHKWEDEGNVGEFKTCSKRILRKLSLLQAPPEEIYGKEPYAPSGSWEGWLSHCKTEVYILRETGYQGLYFTGHLLPEPVLLKSLDMFAQGI